MMETAPFNQEMYDRLVKAGDRFDRELEALRNDFATGAQITRLRQDLAGENDVALNVKGVERAELSLGCALALSTERSHNFEASKLLQDALERNCAQVEACYFWLAIARYHLGEFRESRLWCERLLLRKPEDALSRRLLALVRSRVVRDGYSGLAIVVGVVAVSALAGNLFNALRRNA